MRGIAGVPRIHLYEPERGTFKFQDLRGFPFMDQEAQCSKFQDSHGSPFMIQKEESSEVRDPRGFPFMICGRGIFKTSKFPWIPLYESGKEMFGIPGCQGSPFMNQEGQC